MTRPTIEEDEDTGVGLRRASLLRLEQTRQTETEKTGAADLQDFPTRQAARAGTDNGGITRHVVSLMPSGEKRQVRAS